MVYVQFGTEDDRYMKKLCSMKNKNDLEYTELINTPQIKKMDFHIFHSKMPLEVTQEFLLLVLLELERKTEDHHFSVKYHGRDFELDIVDL